MSDTQTPSNDELNSGGVPTPQSRVMRAMPGSISLDDSGVFAPGATLPASADTVTQVVPIAGSALVRGRLKFTCAGTLSFAYRRPPKGAATSYTAATPHANVAVAADTETYFDITPGGEAWLAITFAASGAAGEVTFFDIMQSEAATAAGGESFIGEVGVGSFYDSDETTLPTGTPTYTIGDVMANSATAPVLGELEVARVPGGSVFINDIKIATDQAANVAQVRVHLYSVPRASLPTPTPVDDAAMLYRYDNQPYYQGYIDLPAVGGEAGTDTAAVSQPAFNPQKFFQCAAGDTKLYYLLQTNTSFARAASQKWLLSAGGQQN